MACESGGNLMILNVLWYASVCAFQWHDSDKIISVRTLRKWQWFALDKGFGEPSVDMGLKLPARYFLLSTFATLTFWILFNIMSFMYTGNSNYVIRGQRRHLENDSPTDYFFERELVQEDIFSTLGMIRSHEDERIREEGYGKHAFNELISNRLGFHREIQDTRHEM